MTQRIRSNQSSTRKAAGVGYRKPNSNKNERGYKVKSGADTELAILPAEEPLPFELLHTKVAEDRAPDGPVEESLVHTIAYLAKPAPSALRCCEVRFRE